MVIVPTFSHGEDGHPFIFDWSDVSTINKNDVNRSINFVTNMFFTSEASTATQHTYLS